MEKKYFYLRYESNFSVGKKFIARDRIDVDDIHKLALFAISLEPKSEVTLAFGHVSTMEEYFMMNKDNELKVVFEKIRTDSFAQKFLCIDINLCLLEECFRKSRYDKSENEKLIECYKKYMIDYQVDLQVNNNFYEKDYVGEKFENYGKKVLNFRKK